MALSSQGRLRRHLGTLLYYARVSAVRPWHLALPVVLGLLGATIEGSSLALLIPLSQGMAENSMAFLWDLPVFSEIGPYMPEAILASPRFDALMTVGLVLLVFATRLGRIAVEYANNLFMFARNQRYDVAVRTDTFRRLLTFGRQYFQQKAAGETHTMLDWSTSTITMLRTIDEFLINSMRLIAKVSIMLAISWQLTVGMALAFPLLQALLSGITRTVVRIAMTASQAALRVQREVFDVLATIPLVKAYSRENETVARYHDTLDTLRKAGIAQERVRQLSYPTQEAVIIITMFLTGATLILGSGDFHPGDLARFAAFLLVAQQSMPNFMGINRVRIGYLELVPILDTLGGLLSDEDKHIVRGGTETFTGVKEGITLRDLRFNYVGGVQALAGIDAFIPAGKMTAIVGESGAGKSTLVDLLARFYECPAGSILLDGRDIREFSLESLHERMTITSQDVWLLNRSLRDNLHFGLGTPPSDERLLQVIRDVGLEPMLSGLKNGLSTEVGDRGVKLSGGERQRLALARGLLREPDIIILDEATAALDSVTELRVQAAMSNFAKGRTVLAIAHRLSTIRAADQILVIDAGKIVETGTWDELLQKQGPFRRLYDAQQGTAPKDEAA